MTLDMHATDTTRVAAKLAQRLQKDWRDAAPASPLEFEAPTGFSSRALHAALALVLRKRVAVGNDGISPAQLRASPAARRWLVRTAHRHLRSGDYRFHPARIGSVHRHGRPDRHHMIPTMNDAVVLRAVADAVSPAWETLPPSIRGGRPGCSAHQVVEEITIGLARARAVLRFDIASAFESADHEAGVERLARRTKRADCVALLRRFRADQPRDKFPGLIEGSAVAPLLLAMILADTMVALESIGPAYLWLDDGLVLVPNLDEAERAREVVALEVGRVGMTLHSSKTVVRAIDPAELEPDWNYLGFRWAMGLPEPPPEEVDALVKRVGRYLASGELGRADCLLRGWASYFAASPNTGIFAELDARIRWEYGDAAVSLPKVANLAVEMIALPEAKGPPRPVESSATGGWRGEVDEEF